jgi:hypothetical protein
MFSEAIRMYLFFLFRVGVFFGMCIEFLWLVFYSLILFGIIGGVLYVVYKVATAYLLGG